MTTEVEMMPIGDKPNVSSQEKPLTDKQLKFMESQARREARLRKKMGGGLPNKKELKAFEKARRQEKEESRDSSQDRRSSKKVEKRRRTAGPKPSKADRAYENVPVSEFEREMFEHFDKEKVSIRNERELRVRQRTVDQNIARMRANKDFQAITFQRHSFVGKFKAGLNSKKTRQLMEHAMRTHGWTRFAATPESWSKSIESRQMFNLVDELAAEFRVAIQGQYGQAFRVAFKKVRITGGGLFKKKAYSAYGFFVKYARYKRPEQPDEELHEPKEDQPEGNPEK